MLSFIAVTLYRRDREFSRKMFGGFREQAGQIGRCRRDNLLRNPFAARTLTHVLPPIATSGVAHLCRKRPFWSILAPALLTFPFYVAHPIRSIVSRSLPLGSPATRRGLPAMSLIPFAPFGDMMANEQG